jgi:hypothetical protein
VVLVFTTRGSATGGIRIDQAVGAPVVLTVPGAVDSTVRVIGLRASPFALSGPVTFSATLRNAGTVHRDFHEERRLAVEVNGGRVTFGDFSVLRGATRTVTATWSDPPLICLWCRADVALRLPDGTVSRAEATVTVFPLHLVAIGLAGAAGAVVIVRLRRRRYRADVLAAARALDDPRDMRA